MEIRTTRRPAASEALVEGISEISENVGVRLGGLFSLPLVDIQRDLLHGSYPEGLHKCGLRSPVSFHNSTKQTWQARTFPMMTAPKPQSS